MAKAHSTSGYGSGWHKQSLRHSNARKLGRAGGVYRNTHGQIMTDPIAISIHKMLKPSEKHYWNYPSITPLEAEKLIAKDHLREDPLYYKKLATIERKKPTQDLNYRLIPKNPRNKSIIHYTFFDWKSANLMKKRLEREHNLKTVILKD
jgi:hypothetical protein